MVRSDYVLKISANVSSTVNAIVINGRKGHCTTSCLPILIPFMVSLNTFVTSASTVGNPPNLGLLKRWIHVLRRRWYVSKYDIYVDKNHGNEDVAYLKSFSNHLKHKTWAPHTTNDLSSIVPSKVQCASFMASSQMKAIRRSIWDGAHDRESYTRKPHAKLWK